ncbi:MAG: type II secretion system protein [Planctomycetota bacterium]|jgi:type II secretory pathway pseudopilin PulG
MTSGRGRRTIRSRARPVRGFTYAELLAAVVITGIGICAAMAGIRTGLDTSHNTASMELSRHLADSLRQYSMGLAFSDPQGGATFGPEEASFAQYDDLDDLVNLFLSPPVDENGTVMTEYAAWGQRILIKNIDPATLLEAADGTTDLLRIKVIIERDGLEIGEYPWFRANL